MEMMNGRKTNLNSSRPMPVLCIVRTFVVYLKTTFRMQFGGKSPAFSKQKTLKKTT
jgi:hypothetical protein